MSTEALLTADEVSTISLYDGMLSVRATNLTRATVNSKSWFTGGTTGLGVNMHPITIGTHFLLGARLYFTAAGDRHLFGLNMDVGSNDVWLNMKATGAIGFGQGQTAAAVTATGLLQPNTEHFVEVDVTLDNAAPIVIHLDGVQVYSGTIDTQQGSVTGFNGLLFVSTNVGGTHLRDLYCLSVDGTAPQTRLGPGRAQTIRPSAAGNANQWTHDDGTAGDANSYTEVDDTDPDDDTTYLKSGTVGEKDTFAYANLSGTTGTIGAVMKYMRAEKDDTATRVLRNLCRSSGGTEAQGADKAMPQGAYGWFWDSFSTEPGGASWTRTKVDGAEWGRIVNT